jgi:hypothetical protein
MRCQGHAPRGQASRAGLHGFPNSGIPSFDLVPEIRLIARKQQGWATIQSFSPVLIAGEATLQYNSVVAASRSSTMNKSSSAV